MNPSGKRTTFRLGDVVEFDPGQSFDLAYYMQYGLTPGMLGTVTEIAGFRGPSIYSDPMRKLLAVRWQHPSGQTITIGTAVGSVKKIASGSGKPPARRQRFIQAYVPRFEGGSPFTTESPIPNPWKPRDIHEMLYRGYVIRALPDPRWQVYYIDIFSPEDPSSILAHGEASTRLQAARQGKALVERWLCPLSPAELAVKNKRTARRNPMAPWSERELHDQFEAEAGGADRAFRLLYAWRDRFASMDLAPSFWPRYPSPAQVERRRVQLFKEEAQRMGYSPKAVKLFLQIQGR